MNDDVNQPRRHHFIPRFCLAEFADANDKVWTYDSLGERPRSSAPEKTGFERDFHTVTAEGGPDLTVENDIAKWESAAAPIYRQLADGKEITSDDRQIMAGFFALAYLRSKRHRRSYAEGYGLVMQRLVQKLAEKPNAFDVALNEVGDAMERQFTDDKKIAHRQEMADWRGYRIEVSREATLPVFSAHPALADEIAGMRWSVLEAKGEQFILSDSPLILANPTGGFGDAAAQATLPLTPSRLWVGHRRDYLPQHSTLQRREVMAFNRMRAANADRFLYASRCDNALMRLCKNHVRPRQTVTIDGDTSMLAPVTVRSRA